MKHIVTVILCLLCFAIGAFLMYQYYTYNLQVSTTTDITLFGQTNHYVSDCDIIRQSILEQRILTTDEIKTLDKNSDGKITIIDYSLTRLEIHFKH